ncbi:MAG: D-alanyl-D-alanine carboxypeptidase family protein [Spirulina sp. SIO3F2]|nr:D-alanyl-D-alanine carboxypeptidase family protein [Spirulina sp. SIO3F2]
MLKQTRNSKSTVSDDIPIAARDVPQRRSNGQISWLQVGLALFFGSSIITMGVVFWWWQRQTNQLAVDAATTVEPEEPQLPPTDNIRGHLPYEEADEADLVAVTADGSIRLQTAAATEFKAMLSAAQAAGIILVPLSGYRSESEQEYLFFEVKAERNQDTSERAKVSAPPGFSEHHTGYAIDIGDANVPYTHLNEAFEETPAFAWLEANAARYSFELSFPQGNPQGINYEPWHWRFVGDRVSLETFHRAQHLPTAPENTADAEREE